jgi:hypothetical protein
MDADFLVENHGTIFINETLLASGKNAIGGWVDNGKVWLEIVRVYPQSMRDLAISMGRRLNQISIADLDAISRGDFQHAFLRTDGTGSATEFDKVTTFQKLSQGDDRPVFLLFDLDTSPEVIHQAVTEIWARQKAAKKALAAKDDTA